MINSTTRRKSLKPDHLSIQDYHSKVILISYCIWKELPTILHKYVPEVAFYIIFCNYKYHRILFKDKERLPDPLSSNIVYGFNWPSWKPGYVGFTSPNLKWPMCENKGIPYKTVEQTSNASFSVVQLLLFIYSFIYLFFDIIQS